MKIERYEYLCTQILGSKDFKELAEENIKTYSRSSPTDELETIRVFERIKQMQELVDLGQNLIEQQNK